MNSLAVAAAAADGLGAYTPHPFSLIGLVLLVVLSLMAGVRYAHRWRKLLAWAAAFGVAVSFLGTGFSLGGSLNYGTRPADWAALSEYVFFVTGIFVAIVGLGIGARMMFERIAKSKPLDGHFQ